MSQDVTEQAPKKSRRKLVIIAVLVVVLAGGGFAAMTFLGGGEEEPEWTEQQATPEGAVLDVATLTSTLSGDASLARVGLAVVAAEGAAEDQVVARFPLIKDAAVTELARTAPDELRTADGADQLRRRLTKRTRKIYPDGEVLRVLLTELVVQ